MSPGQEGSLRLTVGPGHDLAVRAGAPDVTVGEVVAAGAGRPPGDLVGVGARPLDPATLLHDAGLRPGQVLSPDGPGLSREAPSGLVVAVVAGVDAGRSVPLPVGELQVGRALGRGLRLASNGVSKLHCTLRLGSDGVLSVVDGGSVNGTVIGPRVLGPDDGWVDVEIGDLIRCGPAVVVVRAVPPPDTPRSLDRSLRAGGSGAVPYYRSPTDLIGAPEVRIALPAPPRPPRRARLSILPLLMPLAIGGILVAVTHKPEYALFVLLSPLMLLSSFFERRIRGRKATKRSRGRYRAEVAEFAEDVATARADELRRLRTVHPDVAEVARRAAVLSARLWERRPTHPQWMQLTVGIGDVPWRPPVSEAPGLALGEVEQVLEQAGSLELAPVTVDAGAGSTIGVAGSRAAALATVRGLLAQTAAFHGPADVRIAVICAPARAGEWEWAKWLPHTQPAFSSGRPLLIAGTPDRAALDDLMVDAGVAALLLTVIDTEDQPDNGDGAVRALLRERQGRGAGIVIAPTTDGLPDLCDAVIECHDVAGETSCRWPRQDGKVIEAVGVGLGVAEAEGLARGLAQISDPDATGGSASLPTRVGLGDLLDLGDRSSPEGLGRAVADRWRVPGRRLEVPVGVGDDGPVRVDLGAQGPHLMVLGARGTGKTEALCSLALGLATGASPEELSLVLWGESFARLRRLPHLAGEINRVDEDTVRRMVDGLDREIGRRERLALVALGASGSPPGSPTGPGDLDGPPAGIAAGGVGGGVRGGDGPALVVLIDDVDTVMRVAPRATEDLVRLLRRSRGLGVHVVMSAGRSGGHAMGDLIDLASLRLVLRVATPQESTEALGIDAAARLDRSLTGRGYLLAGRGEARELQTATVTVAAPRPAQRLEVRPFTLASARTGGGGAGIGDPDERWLVPAIAAAGVGHRRPSDLLSSARAAETALVSPGLPELLGLGDVGALDPAQTWQRGRGADLLRVPIGVDPDGRAVVVDLKESALEGMGPHGLLVGATGSGKSELLRTLVTALAVTHSPEVLSLVLVDFKGGANFASMTRLPHVAGMITNLADDLALVDRVLAALDGEQRRRQEVLARAGNLASVREYRAARDAGADLPPLPELLIVVDEFAELLDKQPEFIDFFLTIGRVGRSLGIHLLLASQRLEEGKLRGLDTYLSYRLGLRTFSAAESRTVLGVPDAYTLPSAPGGGYLKVGTDHFDRFQASYVSTPYVPPPGAAPAPPVTPPGENPPAGGAGEVGGEADGEGPTIMSSIVDRVSGAGSPVHQIWLPPLPAAIPLDGLLGGGFVHHPERGFAASAWPAGRLVVPAGLVDEPDLQRQVPLLVDFAGSESNLLVVGAPQTGKSTLLRSLLLALAVTHTPAEVQCYAADFGGGTLAALSGIPHIGTIASRLEGDRVRRLIGHVESVLAARERLFRDEGIDSAATFRARRLAGTLPADVGGDVFLCIDGWAAFRGQYEGLEPVVADVAARGQGYGLHVVITANRIGEVRAVVAESMGGRLELRLNNPADSMVDRRKAVTIKAGQDGRGLTPTKRFFQAALPRLDAQAGVDQLQEATKLASEYIAARWDGPVAPPVRLLPARVDPADLPVPGPGGPAGVAVGITEEDLAPWWLDLAGGDPHLLVFGDGEAGKTTFLRALVTAVAATYPPETAQVLVVDYRRTLLEAVPPSHLLGYGPSEPAVRTQVAQLVETLTARLPAADVTARALRERSWWSGPELYVVIDDYDLVVTASGNPLAPLLPFVAQGRDVGFHLVIARRVQGTAKALFEPVLSRTREVCPAGLVLSGDRNEGPLVGGVRAGEQVPGRGLWVRPRRAPLLVQVADVKAPED